MVLETTRMKAGKLMIKIYESRLLMGAGAAYDVAENIKGLLEKQDFVNIIFASAPSQNEFLGSLSGHRNLRWNRINAFHMDEYVGLDQNDPAAFGHFLKERIFDKLPFHAVHLLSGSAEDLRTECEKYAALLARYPVDIVCMGIGENAHLAFNDPPVADFNDRLMVKVVHLDDVSRQQQIHDDCFRHIEDVPTSAITLTIPALLQANSLYCIVPGSSKALAVHQTLNEEVKEAYPSTVLRRHRNAILYLDKDSSIKI